MHPKWRCVFHIQPEREPCSGEGHDHHRKKRRTVGWVCKSIAETTNLALGRNLKESARTEQVAFAATGATAFNASDDGWLRSIFHPPATRVRHASSDVQCSTFNGLVPVTWMGLEGIVSNRIGSRYVSGRTRAWLKTKNPNFEKR